MAAPMFNFNVGILGHVDSGKTSLSKALSTTASTACFDKNPQSKERGITLDLGFSSFQLDVPTHLSQHAESGVVQYTLVDCPGHASLIKTIIGGAQIIDLMFLVVDVVKGMQTQTAECLVIGEITCEKMIVVLNKMDLIPPDKKQSTVEKIILCEHRLSDFYYTDDQAYVEDVGGTRFAGSPVVAVAAKPGGPDSGDVSSEGLGDLFETLRQHTYIPQRQAQGPFLFSVDHCFSIRGQGTVLTGTALSGQLAVNDNIEIPSMKVTKKVKSIQMFRKPVDKIQQGDRAGVCVTQFDPSLLERGIVCTPGALPTMEAAIVSINRIPYYKGIIASKAKFHITSGHDTVMGRLSIFGDYSENSLSSETAALSLDSQLNFDLSKDYLYQDELLTAKKTDRADSGGTVPVPVKQYALIQFEKPVTCQQHALIIGSKLDTDIHANVCRIAFHGRILLGISDPQSVATQLSKVKVYKVKVKEGLVERVMDTYTVIGKNLFKKETNVATFTDTTVYGEAGVIEGGFGQSGKIKIRISAGLPDDIVKKYSGAKKKSKKGEEESTNQEDTLMDKDPIRIILSFKRYIYDLDKKMRQT